MGDFGLGNDFEYNQWCSSPFQLPEHFDDVPFEGEELDDSLFLELGLVDTPIETMDKESGISITEQEIALDGSDGQIDVDVDFLDSVLVEGETQNEPDTVTDLADIFFTSSMIYLSTMKNWIIHNYQA